MALVLADRVRESSTTTGTGTLVLTGAVVGYQSFSTAIGNTNTTYYTISNPGTTEWEVGIGTVSTGSLTRTTVLSSSNANALVAFTAGTKDVFVTYPAEKAVYTDASGNVSLSGTFAGTISGTGAFTTLSVSSTVSGTGFSTYLASPPAIGTTTAAAGAFTTLSASSTLTLSGGTANGVAYLNASKQVTSGSALTFDGTNLGIGTSSPATKLDVNGLARCGDLYAAYTGSSTFYIRNIGGENRIDSYNWPITASYPLAILGSYIKFSTSDVERMRIDSSGNVGIGTSSPGSMLDVAGSVRSTAAAPFFELISGSTSTGGIYSPDVNSVNILARAGKSLIFMSGGTAERMRIDSSGNVGIGTSSPSTFSGYTTLQVNNATNGGMLLLTNGTQTYWNYVNSGGGWLGTSSNHPLMFQTNGTERMRIDSSGNVGIGTSSPSTKLSIVTATSNAGVSINDGTVNTIVYNTSSANATFGTTTNHPVAFYTNNAERMRIDTSGNVGIGTSPSAWNSPLKAMQVIGASISNNNNTTLISSNVYRAASYVATYYSTTYAGELQFNADGLGAWSFATAPVGTAGTTCTLSERMRIDSSGNVGIGSIPSATGGQLQIFGAANRASAQIAGNANGMSVLNQNGLTVYTNLSAGSTDTTLVAGSTALTYMAFGIHNGTSYNERMRIDSSGNVNIGSGSAADTSGRYFDIYNTGSSASAFAILRLITQQSASSSPTSVDILKNKSGAFVLNNNETNSAAFTSFGVGASERMRIDSSGNLLVGTTSTLSPGGVSGFGNILNPNNNGVWALALQNNATTGGLGRGLGIRNATDFNTTSSEFIYCIGNATPRFFVQSNGGIYNYSANNSNLSDSRVKKDVAPVDSWLNKINAIEVVNFKYKDQTHDDFNIGVIAQQVLSVAPELINENGFGDTPEDGKPLLSIYETDLMYAMLKAIQELKAELDELKSQLGK